MNDEMRSGCPIANTLDIVGDRWTLVVLRDLFTGKDKFSDFLTSPEGIATNVLSSRLQTMEANGLVEKTVYQRRPKRFAYKLTQKGHDLLPVLQSMCRWANAHVPGTWTPPDWFMSLKA